MPVERHVRVGIVLAISMVCALALMRPAATADYIAPQFSQVGITPEIQDLGQYEVKVAILDGLADPRHRDLRGQVKGVFGFGNGTYTRYDNHGTFVAGIIGARENRRGIVGAAPNAKLYSYGVFDDFSFVYAQATSISLQDAAARGVTIANMSYGVPSQRPGQPTPLFTGDDLFGINQVRDSILAVRAAGNDAEQLASWEIHADAGVALKNLIIVGSVDASNNLSYFSNRPGDACFYNDGTCLAHNQLKKLTLVAPGENWISTVPGGYAIGSGTSFAAPVVAGAAALLQSRWEHLQSDPEATRQILFDSATDLGEDGVDGVYGWGLLNVTAAFEEIGTPTFITIAGRHPLKASGLSGGAAFAALPSSDILVSGFDKFDRDFAYRLSDFVAPQQNVLSSRLTAYLDGISSGPTAVPASVRLSENLQIRLTVPAEPAAGQGRAATFTDEQTPKSDWQLTYRPADDGGWFAFGYGAATGLTSSAEVATYGAPGVRSAAAADPIQSFANGGAFGVLGQSIGDHATVALGFHQSGDDETSETAYGAQALSLDARVEPVEGLRLGATGAYLTEDSGALGSTGSGAFSLDGDEYTTQGLTFAADYTIAPDVTVSGTFTTALTTQSSAAGAFALDGPVHSEAISLGIAKTGLLNGRDRLTLSVSQPLRVSQGSTTLRLGDHLDARGNLVFRDQDISLEPEGRQIDFQVGYESTTDGGLAFEAGAYFSRDDGHLKGATDAGAIARLSLKF